MTVQFEKQTGRQRQGFDEPSGPLVSVDEDFALLTAEEREILGLLALAVPMDGVARRMHLSERSVRRRLRVVCDRIGVGAPIEAVVWAVRRGYL